MNFLDPHDALKQFQIYGTQDVADFGAGAGHFAFAAARRLDGGRLFAIDLEKEMLTRLVAEAKLLGHTNIFPIWADAAKPKSIPLADASLDAIIIANVLNQVDDRNGLIDEAKRLLKPDGKILFIEWKDSQKGGPHGKHKVPEHIALSLFNKHGFGMDRYIDAGEYHYGIIMVRN